MAFLHKWLEGDETILFGYSRESQLIVENQRLSFECRSAVFLEEWLRLANLLQLILDPMYFVCPQFCKNALIAFCSSLLLAASLHAQPFVDACFSSPAVGPSFTNTANVNNRDADLLSWNGSNWTGGWPGANIVLAPPGVAGTRAIWSGDGTVWTTGGEGFGLRLITPIVTGTTYTFTFRRVSHGTGQNGTFAPILYTNAGGSFGTSYGAIPAVGTAWANPNISFTATAASSGHTFVYFHNNVGSGMFMGCTTAILPMAFSDLTAMQAGETVQLQWEVRNELDYLWHVIERSEDGISFVEVGRSPSVQAGDEGHTYTHEDATRGIAANTLLYYRIRSIDLEGKAAMSPVVMTLLGAPTRFEAQVFPNPAASGGSANVAFFATSFGRAHYRICELSGRCLREGEWTLQATHNQQSLQLQALPAGMYLLDIETIDGRARTKFRVQ